MLVVDLGEGRGVALVGNRRQRSKRFSATALAIRIGRGYRQVDLARCVLEPKVDPRAIFRLEPDELSK
jgi:hypothetical protein